MARRRFEESEMRQRMKDASAHIPCLVGTHNVNLAFKGMCLLTAILKRRELGVLS